jgi:glycosyltransferase involved in cell wall biosynthesis
LKLFNITKPFILYTGSAYPHKNLPRLIKAVKIIREKHQVTLVIVSARSVFTDALIHDVQAENALEYVRVLGFVSDTQLAALYTHALALAHPSVSEGFGLTGLEAMQKGLPVVSSTAGSLPEVYGNAALYADPDNTSDWVRQLTKLITDAATVDKLQKLGPLHAARYSWQQTARQTLDLYRQVIRQSKGS